MNPEILKKATEDLGRPLTIGEKRKLRNILDFQAKRDSCYQEMRWAYERWMGKVKRVERLKGAS